MSQPRQPFVTGPAGRARRSFPTLAALLAGLLLGSGTPAAEAEGPGTAARKELVDDINRRVADDYPALEGLYKHVHTHPELSLQ